MKIHNPPWKGFAGLAAVTLALVGTVGTVNAASIALNGQVTLRPLTPTEISTNGYSLTNAQRSAGIGTVALGEPVYLDAMVTASIAATNILSVTWSMTTNNIPLGSQARLTNSPLGTNVPLFKTGDRVTGGAGGAPSPYLQLAGRTFFRPDVVGQYTVLATITTTGHNGTNTIAPVTTNLAITISASIYLGVNDACEACHSGGLISYGADNIYPLWTNTLHASMFTRGINGQVSSHYSQSCIQCHTLGYDTNSFTAPNLNFYAEAQALGWTFPSVLTNSNWAAVPAALQNLANIQCENCHGAGSQHPFSNGLLGNTNEISVSYGAGDCSQCHDSLPTEYQSAEWNNSLHASSARETSPACVRCHTAPGFAGWATAGGMSAQNLYPNNVISAYGLSTNILTTPPNTTYEAVTCQACHDPHNASNPNQLRLGYNVTLSDGTVVTNAGAGGFCMECHNSRNGSVTNMLAKYPLNQTNWAGGVAFGPHDSPQGDMLEGVNAVTYGQVIPSAPHANVVADTCAGCHMQPVAATVVVNGVTNANPAFTLAGGHSTKMSYTNSLGVKVPVANVCNQCHGAVTNFDILVPDYVGYGYSQGIQTQVQILLNQLSMLLPPTTYQANPSNYVADGLVKTASTFRSVPTNWPTRFLQAVYNWQFVEADGSLGVHNGPFAVGLLKASIANLTGISTTGGLPDVWEIQYFGNNFATNPAASPNAINNSAGVPNWMMYALGLAPTAGFTVANGVIYFDGDNIVNGATNTIAIYEAAEIAFNTQKGVNYQIQGITALTGSWQNISTNIPGTGGSISYLTPMRDNVQMFFRVVHTP